MRILIIHSIYRPYKKGGAEVVVEKFVNELKKTHEVIVLTAMDHKTWNPAGEQVSNGASMKHETKGRYTVSVEDGVIVIRFSPFNIFSIHEIESKSLWKRLIWHALDAWNIYSWFVMRNVLKKYTPDVIWTHTMKGIGYLPLKAVLSYKLQATSYKPRWVLTPHNEEYVYQFGYGLSPFRVGLIEKITMIFTRWFTRGPDLIFSPSKQIQDFYRDLGFWKGVPGSWDWPVFVKSRIKNQESRIKNATSPFTFGFLGQLEDHKGVRLLVDAFRSYQSPNVKLLVAGRGNLSQYVTKESRKDSRIEFFGEYRTNQLDELFQNIDILVVPSTIRDNMPTVILEAFAHGVPVIGSNLGGIPEVLSGGKGLLLRGLKAYDFHEQFDQVRDQNVYSSLLEAIVQWQPLTVCESLKKIGL